MKAGLKKRHFDAIVSVLSSNPAVERAVLFGSRATGGFQPASDVDIALFGPELTLSDLASLSAAMEALTVPQRVDLLLFDRLENPALREHIEKEGIVIFTRESRSSG